MATTDRSAGDGIVVTIPAALAERLRDGVSAGDLHARAEDHTWAATYKPPATREEWLADVRTPSWASCACVARSSISSRV